MIGFKFHAAWYVVAASVSTQEATPSALTIAATVGAPTNQVTAAPAALSRPLTIPAASLVTVVSVEPAANTITLAIPTPTNAMESRVSVATAIVGAVPVPAIERGIVEKTPAAVPVSISQPAIALEAGIATKEPAALLLSESIPAPFVWTETASVQAVAAIVSAPTSSVERGIVEMTPGAVAVAPSVPEPYIDAGQQTAMPGAALLSGSIGSSTLELGTIDCAVLAVSSALSAPVVIVELQGLEVNPAALAQALALPNALIEVYANPGGVGLSAAVSPPSLVTGGVELTSGAVPPTIAVPAQAIEVGGIETTPAAVAVLGGTPTPALQAVVEIVVDAATLVLSAPAITGDQTVDAGFSATIAVQTPTIEVGVVVINAGFALSLSLPAGTNEATNTVAAIVVTASAPEPYLQPALIATPVVIQCVASIGAASLETGVATIGPSAITANFSLPDPSTSGFDVVTPSGVSLTLSVPDPEPGSVVLEPAAVPASAAVLAPALEQWAIPAGVLMSASVPAAINEIGALAAVVGAAATAPTPTAELGQATLAPTALALVLTVTIPIVEREGAEAAPTAVGLLWANPVPVIEANFEIEPASSVLSASPGTPTTGLGDGFVGPAAIIISLEPRPAIVANPSSAVSTTLVLLRASTASLRDQNAATLITVTSTDPSGTLIISAPSLDDSTDLGTVDFVRIFALGRKVPGAGSCATASFTRVRWTTPQGSDSWSMAGDPFPLSANAQDFALLVTPPIVFRPDGAPWRWSDINSLTSLGVEQDFALGASDYFTLGIAELWVEVSGLPPVSSGSFERMLGLDFSAGVLVSVPEYDSMGIDDGFKPVVVTIGG